MGRDHLGCQQADARDPQGLGKEKDLDDGQVGTPKDAGRSIGMDVCSWGGAAIGSLATCTQKYAEGGGEEH